ncbi:MAG: AAA family ATPase [Solirubrobacteraceae bacterium]
MSQQPGKNGSDAVRRSIWRRRSLGFWCVTGIAVLVLFYAIVLEASRPHLSGDRLRLDGFYNLVETNRVTSATILDQDRVIVGAYKRSDGSVRRFYMPFSRNGNTAQDDLVKVLVDNNRPTRVDQQLLKRVAGPLTQLLPALILGIIFLYFILTVRGGDGAFGRGKGSAARVDDVGVTFDDVAGQQTAVTELREVSDFLSNTDRYVKLGAQIPRGILVYGPPGCGKTLLARALAGEAGAAFYSISGSDFVEMYVGIGARRVRDLFKDARENAPAIVFIDELDSVGRRRAGSGGGTGSGEEQGQALNQLLAEIDGFSPAEGVILVGATNRPDVLDPALLRPGRFDRAVGLELPDEQGRLDVLRVHARGKPMSPDVDLASIAKRTVGMTGADLASLVNEGTLLAARAGRSAIDAEDLERGLERVRDAPERQRRLSMRDRRIGQTLLFRERVTFADVAGVEHVIEELAEVRDYLADRTRYEDIGARVPRGYLLTGPPGTGKTLLAHALAGESNAAFISVPATEFVEFYVGEGAARIRDLFAQARGIAPAIVFIDEIDAIGGHRGSAMADSTERAQALNQLLVELDSFAQTAPVIVLAATNRPDMLDSALLRPGRFDRTLTLELPDLNARRSILALHARDRRLAADVDLDAIARLTFGLSGADLDNLLNDAALLAARRSEQRIGQRTIEESLERTGLGIASGHRLSDEDRRLVAYHEAGHALVARALPGGRLLHKISIVPRGGAAGVTWLPEDGDRRLHSRSMLVERMATLLGGRVAEEIVFGEPADTAGNDLAQVTAIARRMVAELGMSDMVGSINYSDRSAHNGVMSYSDDTARLIDAEARRLVNEAEELALGVLTGTRSTLDRIAEALLERETLSMDEVGAIAGPIPAPTARA